MFRWILALALALALLGTFGCHRAYVRVDYPVYRDHHYHHYNYGYRYAYYDPCY